MARFKTDLTLFRFKKSDQDGFIYKLEFMSENGASIRMYWYKKSSIIVINLFKSIV